MDEYYIRITDKANIPVALEPDCEYQIIGEIGTYGEDTTSKQDGTYTHTFKAKFIGEVQLIKGEKVIRGAKKTTWSQKWRRLIEGFGLDYDKFMAWLFTKFDELREEYEASRIERGDE